MSFPTWRVGNPARRPMRESRDRFFNNLRVADPRPSPQPPPGTSIPDPSRRPWRPGRTRTRRTTRPSSAPWTCAPCPRGSPRSLRWRWCSTRSPRTARWRGDSWRAASPRRGLRTTRRTRSSAASACGARARAHAQARRGGGGVPPPRAVARGAGAGAGRVRRARARGARDARGRSTRSGPLRARRRADRKGTNPFRKKHVASTSVTSGGPNPKRRTSFPSRRRRPGDPPRVDDGGGRTRADFARVVRNRKPFSTAEDDESFPPASSFFSAVFSGDAEVESALERLLAGERSSSAKTSTALCWRGGARAHGPGLGPRRRAVPPPERAGGRARGGGGGGKGSARAAAEGALTLYVATASRLRAGAAAVRRWRRWRARRTS